MHETRRHIATAKLPVNLASDLITFSGRGPSAGSWVSFGAKRKVNSPKKM